MNSENTYANSAQKYKKICKYQNIFVNLQRFSVNYVDFDT